MSTQTCNVIDVNKLLLPLSALSILHGILSHFRIILENIPIYYVIGTSHKRYTIALNSHFSGFNWHFHIFVDIFILFDNNIYEIFNIVYVLANLITQCLNYHSEYFHTIMLKKAFTLIAIKTHVLERIHIYHVSKVHCIQIYHIL